MRVQTVHAETFPLRQLSGRERRGLTRWESEQGIEGEEAGSKERPAFLTRGWWWCGQGKIWFVLQLAEYWAYPLTHSFWDHLVKTIARISSCLSFPQVWTKQCISLDLIWLKLYSIIPPLEISLTLSRVRQTSQKISFPDGNIRQTKRTNTLRQAAVRETVRSP